MNKIRSLQNAEAETATIQRIEFSAILAAPAGGALGQRIVLAASAADGAARRLLRERLLLLRLLRLLLLRILLWKLSGWLVTFLLPVLMREENNLHLE